MSVITASAIAASTTAALLKSPTIASGIPTTLKSDIHWHRWDAKTVVRRGGTICSLTGLGAWLIQHCCHLLCEQGDMLIQRLLISGEGLDGSRQVRRNSYGRHLVRAAERAPHGCRCCRRCRHLCGGRVNTTLDSSSPTKALKALWLGAYPICPDVFRKLDAINLRWYADWTCSFKAGHVFGAIVSQVSNSLFRKMPDCMNKYMVVPTIWASVYGAPPRTATSWHSSIRWKEGFWCVHLIERRRKRGIVLEKDRRRRATERRLQLSTDGFDCHRRIPPL